MHDWRSILDEIRVPWADQGPNTSPGNLNIACPFCRDDPSHHMSIGLGGQGFFCFRDNRHKGTDPVRLLVALGQNRDAATRLLNRHLDGHSPPAEKTPVPASEALRAWNRFSSAAESPACLKYLASRGVVSGPNICARYDLRFAAEGEWAGRLLLPIRMSGAIRSWTGRTVSARTPKYRTQPAPGVPVLYTPDNNKIGRLAVITEGPLDALNISISCQSLPYVALALCGKAMNASKLMEIRWYVSNCDTVLLALDADVSLGQIYQISAELAGVLHAPIIRARLPEGCKDPGELPPESVIPWINAQVLSK